MNMTTDMLTQDLTRICYACGSDKTVQYQYPRTSGMGISELWYTNYPTYLVLCNRCYGHLFRNPRHQILTPPGSMNYWDIHKWARKNRPKPLVCEQCSIHSSKQVANIDGIYEQDIGHFRWMCVSCHAKRDGKGCHHTPRKKRIPMKRKGKYIQHIKPTMPGRLISRNKWEVKTVEGKPTKFGTGAHIKEWLHETVIAMPKELRDNRKEN